MNKEFIVFQGTKFTIEWYFNENNKSEAFEYFEELTPDRKKKAFHLFKILGNAGKLFNEEKFRYEEDQIYAFKPTPDRFLCFFFDGSKIIITNAYEKKTKKMLPREKHKAVKAKDDYTIRNRRGTYYD